MADSQAKVQCVPERPTGGGVRSALQQEPTRRLQTRRFAFPVADSPVMGERLFNELAGELGLLEPVDDGGEDVEGEPEHSVLADLASAGQRGFSALSCFVQLAAVPVRPGQMRLRDGHAPRITGAAEDLDRLRVEGFRGIQVASCPRGCPKVGQRVAFPSAVPGSPGELKLFGGELAGGPEVSQAETEQSRGSQQRHPAIGI